MIAALKYPIFMAASILLAFGLGCAGSRSVVPSDVEADQAPAFIDRNEANVRAYYSGPSSAPTAILLDLKGDGIRLTGNGWQPIPEGELNSLVSAMRSNYRRWGVAAQGPQLSVIRSEEGKTIGYLYSPVEYATVGRVAPDRYNVGQITEETVKTRANPGIKGAGG